MLWLPPLFLRGRDECVEMCEVCEMGVWLDMDWTVRVMRDGVMSVIEDMGRVLLRGDV